MRKTYPLTFFTDFRSQLSVRCPRRPARSLCIFMLCAGTLSLAGCFSIKTEHKVEPIHITMDVNVRLERELESAFSDLDARAREIAEARNQEGDLE